MSHWRKNVYQIWKNSKNARFIGHFSSLALSGLPELGARHAYLSLTPRVGVLDCLQRYHVNEVGDLGYNQFRQTNRYSTHKLVTTLIYRFNATRSKYKGTGAGKEVQARIGS